MGSYPIYENIFPFLLIKYYKITFFIFIIIGTLITISSYSWLNIWLGLEINLISIIPLLSSENRQYPTESALKYFITQVIASLIFLFFIVQIIKENEQTYIFQNKLILTGLFSRIITKIGGAPFHFWFPEVLEGLSWINCLLILTWQKIAPIIILINNFQFKALIVIVIILSLIFRRILGLNQIRIRKILAYSSINHIAWILARIIQIKIVWLIYFFVYSIISVRLVVILNKFKIFFINQIRIFKTRKIENFTFIINFFSLGGLPPFLGFFPKWLTINSLILRKNYFISILLITFTLISLFFYLRITFSTLTFSSVEKSIKTEYINKFLLIFINFFTLSGIIFCTLILNRF